MPISEITQTEIGNTLAPICHTKAGAANTALMRLKLCFKQLRRWAWMLILQAVEKARALLRRDSVVLLELIKRKGSILLLPFLLMHRKEIRCFDSFVLKLIAYAT